jgi:hypothetical protein
VTQVAPTGATFIEWSSTAMAGSSDPSSGQHEGFCPDEHGLVAQSSPNDYPDPDWDSPSVTAVNDEEDAPDSQGLMELPPQSDDRSDSVLAGDPMDDAPWLEDVSWTEDSTPDPLL